MKYPSVIDYDKVEALETRVKAIKGVKLYIPVEATKICLVPNVIVPKNFRVPEFIKYTRTQCTTTHLKSYYNKMIEVVHDKKLLMHFFQDSLSIVALNWYIRLDRTNIQKWKDLMNSFIKKYKYNMDMVRDQSNLLSLEKGSHESVQEYA